MYRDWTASFSIRFRNGTCIIILDKKYNIANSSCHFRSYGSIWTGPSSKQYYMDRSFWGPYNIFMVTDRSIYCHMTLSAMNYLLFSLQFITFKASIFGFLLFPFVLYFHIVKKKNWLLRFYVYTINQKLFEFFIIFIQFDLQFFHYII